MSRLLPLGLAAFLVSLLGFGFFTAVPAPLAYLLSLLIAAAGCLSLRFGRGD